MKNYTIERRTDTNLSNMTERELLIQQGSAIRKLCGSISELKQDNAVEHEKLFQKIDSLMDSKTSNRLFYWVVGIIIVIMMALTSFVGTLNTEVTTVKADMGNMKANLKLIRNDLNKTN